MKTIKCADWRYFAQTVRQPHEAHEWWDTCRGIRWCPGVTTDDMAAVMTTEQTSLILTISSLIENRSTTTRARYAALLALEAANAGRLDDARVLLDKSYANQRNAKRK